MDLEARSSNSEESTDYSGSMDSDDLDEMETTYTYDCTFCDVRFERYESFEKHVTEFCHRRHGLPRSSTVTSSMLSGASSSDVSAPGASSSDVSAPGASSSDVSAPGASSSGFPLPGASSSSFPLPGASSSGFPAPGASSSGFPELGASSSDFPELGVLSSSFPEGALSSGFPDLGALSSGFPDLGALSSGFPDLGALSSGYPRLRALLSGYPRLSALSSGFSSRKGESLAKGNSINIPSLSQIVKDTTRTDSEPKIDLGLGTLEKTSGFDLLTYLTSSTSSRSERDVGTEGVFDFDFARGISQPPEDTSANAENLEHQPRESEVAESTAGTGSDSEIDVGTEISPDMNSPGDDSVLVQDIRVGAQNLEQSFESAVPEVITGTCPESEADVGTEISPDMRSPGDDSVLVQDIRVGAQNLEQSCESAVPEVITGTSPESETDKRSPGGDSVLVQDIRVGAQNLEQSCESVVPEITMVDSPESEIDVGTESLADSDCLRDASEFVEGVLVDAQNREIRKNVKSSAASRKRKKSCDEEVDEERFNP